jgi:hypothetical protein
MKGKFESHSNNYTESNVNRRPGGWALQAHATIGEMPKRDEGPQGKRGRKRRINPGVTAKVTIVPAKT